VSYAATSFRATFLQLGLCGVGDLYTSKFVRRTLEQFVGFIEHFQQPRGVRICSSTSCKQGTHLFRPGHSFYSPTLSLPIVEIENRSIMLTWESRSKI